MKTNEQMIEDLLKRKEAYDKKRAANRRRAALISAALAIILIVSSVPVIAFVANKKTPAPDDVTGEVVTYEQTKDEKTEYTTQRNNENSEKITESLNNEESETNDQIEGKIILLPVSHGTSPFNASFVNVGDYADEEFLYSRMVPQGANGEYSYEAGVWICQHEEIKEYEMSISRNESYSDEKACMILIPSESIEIISDDMIMLDFSKSDINTFRIRFKYREGYTNGKIEFLCFNENDGLNFYSDMDNHIKKWGLGRNYKNDFDFSYPGGKYKRLIFGEIDFATIKGYDFRRYKNADLNMIYKLAAEYFEDVDKDGNPLYEIDPYMPEYYDSPYCWDKRYEYEQAYTAGEQLREFAEIETLQGESENSPLHLFSKQGSFKGGTIRQYSCSFEGVICWTDSNNTSQTAQNVTISVYDTSNPTVPLDSTCTDVDGSYTLSFNIPAEEPLNIAVKVYTTGQGINVKKKSNNTIFEYALLYFNDIPTTYSGYLSKVFPITSGNSSEILFNRAMSVHQSIEMANRYVNNLLLGSDIAEIDVLYYEDHVYDSNCEHEGTHYDYVDDKMIIEYYDAFDWDVIEHEYGHYVADKLGFRGSNSGGYHDQYSNLLDIYNNKEKAIDLAWSEGWADFFAINAQRIMINPNNFSIPNVRDSYYNDTDIPRGEFCSILSEWVVADTDSYIEIDIENYIDTSYIIGLTNLPGFDHTMFKGETNEITVAALLLDFVDGTSTADNDVTQFSDSTIWSIIIGDETDMTDGCKTLSDFMDAFHSTNLLSGSQKLLCMYLLRRYDLNPYNVSVTNINSDSPLITWTNVSAQNYNSIRVFDTSFNQIKMWIPSTTSFNIPASDWSAIKAGNSNIFIVVEGIAGYGMPLTYRYFSTLNNVTIP